MSNPMDRRAAPSDEGDGMEKPISTLGALREFLVDRLAYEATAEGAQRMP